MDSPLPQKYLQIQIQDDLKYDVRIENAKLERYFLFPLPVWEICVLRYAQRQILQ